MLKLFFSTLCLCGLIHFASAQIDMEPSSLDKQINFYYDAVPFSTGDSTNSRVDIYIQLSYDQLTFIHDRQKFLASYEVTATVLTDDERIVTERSWSGKIELADYEQSISRKYFTLSQRSMFIKPGTFDLRLQVADLESKQTTVKKIKLTIPDYYHHESELSGIMIVNVPATDSAQKTINPQLSWNVGNLPKGFSLFFEYYPAGDPDSVHFTYTILSKKKEELFQGNTTRILTTKRNQVFIPIDSLSLPMGTYTLQLESKPYSKKDTQNIVSVMNHPVVIQWNGIPIAVIDMDEAIQQLKYIASSRELDSLENAKTLEEKRKAFAAFWKKRDPTPLTEENERMEEFYLRVGYANKHFSQFRKGWKTDMGMVYIVFGPPDNISRHPFEMDSKPYEIWSYYQVGVDFIFVDYNGFGDYLLTNPNWDLWNRVQR